MYISFKNLIFCNFFTLYAYVVQIIKDLLCLYYDVHIQSIAARLINVL